MNWILLSKLGWLTTELRDPPISAFPTQGTQVWWHLAFNVGIELRSSGLYSFTDRAVTQAFVSFCLVASFCQYLNEFKNIREQELMSSCTTLGHKTLSNYPINVWLWSRTPSATFLGLSQRKGSTHLAGRAGHSERRYSIVERHSCFSERRFHFCYREKYDCKVSAESWKELCWRSVKYFL